VRAQSDPGPRVGVWRRRPVERGVRAGRQVRAFRERERPVPPVVVPEAPELGPALPVVEQWPDVESRLLAHLRGFLYGVERTNRTAASLMQKALAWSHKHREHLGVYVHEEAFYALASGVVSRALVPGIGEEQLFDLYGDCNRMRKVEVANIAARDMRDDRRFKWRTVAWIAGGVAAAGALTAMAATGRAPVMKALLGAAVCGAVVAWKVNPPRFQLPYRE